MRRLLPDPAELDDAGLVEAYRMPEGRHLRANFVVALDGAVTINGRSDALGSPGDRRIFGVLRALADAVVVGHGTAAAEGYRPMTADSPVGGLRASLGRPPTAPIVVVSRRASLVPDSGLVTGAVSPTVLVTCAASDPARRSALDAAGAVVLVCGDDDVDLGLAVDRLADRGLEQLLCEGGPTLLHAALIAGVVDELDLSISPALVGGATRLLPEALPTATRVQLRQLLEEDGLLFSRYGVNP
jgi:riboflavin biosynthesis pyrimidine reductase